MALAASRHRRLKLLDLRERKAGVSCYVFQCKNAVLQHPLRRRKHGFALAARLALYNALGFVAFSNSFNLNSSVEHLTQRCREAESAESISSFENTISYDSNPHEGSHHLKDDATTNSGNCDNASNSHFPPHSQPLCGSA